MCNITTKEPLTNNKIQTTLITIKLALEHYLTINHGKKSGNYRVLKLQSLMHACQQSSSIQAQEYYFIQLVNYVQRIINGQEYRFSRSLRDLFGQPKSLQKIFSQYFHPNVRHKQKEFSFACSNILIAGNNHAAVARSMDFPNNTGREFAFGKIGDVNISNTNMDEAQPHAITWETFYAFMGQTCFFTKNIVDGLNEEGLHASFLYLPGITEYPRYNPKNIRPVLGIGDSANFVLGVARSVPEALDQLRSCQLIENAGELKEGPFEYFFSVPVHLVLRDKYGNTALLEWIKGQTIIYTHYQGDSFVTETNEATGIKNTHPNFTAAVVTNSPAYSWHIQNVKKYNKLFDGNSNKKYDGLYMNGSGLAGLPGDWTPPSRFIRGYILAKLMPAPNSSKQAIFAVNQILASLTAPIDSNPSPTAWVSLSDLENAYYYFKKTINILWNFNGDKVLEPEDIINQQWEVYSLKKLAKENKVPKGWLHALIEPHDKANSKESKTVREMLANSATPGNVHEHVRFSRC